MTITRLTAGASAALILALPALPAAAATLGLDVNVGGTASGSSAGVTTGANVSADADVSTSDSSTSSAMTDAGVSTSGSLVLTRSDATASDTSVSVTDASAVSSDASLDAYARGVLAGDEHVRRVDSSSDHVALSYDEHAWFLGFVPATVSATARVDADGTTKVSYPWYRFLMATRKDAVEASVTGALAADNSSVSGSFSASAQARVLGTLHRAMKAAYESGASADASASATTSASAGY